MICMISILGDPQIILKKFSNATSWNRIKNIVNSITCQSINQNYLKANQQRAIPVLAIGEFGTGQRSAIRYTKRMKRFAAAGTVRQLVLSGASAQVAQLERSHLRAADGEALLPYLIRIVTLPEISFDRILQPWKPMSLIEFI